MIILDTNQLDQIKPPRGPLLAVLSRVASDGGHTLAIPEVVLIEHLAHHWHNVSKHATQMSSAARQLSALIGREVEFEEFSQDDVSELQEGHIRSLFTILDTPESAAKEALT
jgi:hypothetical protein